MPFELQAHHLPGQYTTCYRALLWSERLNKMMLGTNQNNYDIIIGRDNRLDYKNVNVPDGVLQTVMLA